MPSAEDLDPDRTLKRPSVHLRAVPPPTANSTEEIRAEDVIEVAAKLDAVSTQEIAADDILDVIPLRQRIYPNPRITLIPEADAACGTPAIPRAPFWGGSPPRRSLPPPPPPPDPCLSAEPVTQDGAQTAAKISTIAPVALDALDLDGPLPSLRRRIESTFSLDTIRGKRRRLDVGIAIAMGAFVGIFILGFALRSVSASPVVRASGTQSSHAASNGAPGANARAPIAMSRPPVLASAPLATPGATPGATSGATSGDGKTASSGAASTPGSSTPTFDVSSLPQAPVGTVTIAPVASGHRLFIDGAVASQRSAVVSCGKHVVRIGSRGHEKSIDVPCGGEVVVAP